MHRFTQIIIGNTQIPLSNSQIRVIQAILNQRNINSPFPSMISPCLPQCMPTIIFSRVTMFFTPSINQLPTIHSRDIF